MLGFPPFTITCYGADMVRRGSVGRPLSINGAVRVGAPGDLAFTLDADDRRVKHLTADGARCRVDYRYSADSPAEPLISGTVQEVAGTGGVRSSTRSFVVADDWNWFNDLLGWPNPTGSITQQGAEGAYFTRKGPAETVLKQVVAAAASRVGLALTVPASLGRGTSLTLSYRMHSIAERAFPAVVDAGLVPRIIQIDDQLTLDVTVPTVRARVLTQQSGIVTADSEFQISPPTATRIVVGASGEAEARDFRLFIDDARELKYGGGGGRRFIRERFVDARDAGSDLKSARETLAAATADLKEKIGIYNRAMERRIDFQRVRDRAQLALDQAKDYLQDHPTLQRAIDRRDQAQARYDEANSDYQTAIGAATTATTDRDQAEAARNTANTAIPPLVTTYEAELLSRANEQLAEGAPRGSLTAKLVETPRFRFGRTFMLGDRVSVQLAGSPVLTDYVREVQFSWDKQGRSIVPLVGNWQESSNDVILAAVAGAMRDVRDLQRSS